MSTLTRKSDTHEEWYAHFEVVNPQVSHITVFARRLPGDVWEASLSMCAHGDQFNKKIGRQVARRRFFRERLSRTYFSAHLSARDLYDVVAKHVVYSVS